MKKDQPIDEATSSIDKPSKQLADGGRHDRPALPAAAQRALAEAEERRKNNYGKDEPPGPKEIAGRDGPEPVRFGDWEKDGIISDF